MTTADDLLDRACTDLGAPTLRGVAEGSSGAARLVVQKTFEPIRCITVAFDRDRIRVHVIGYAHGESRRVEEESGDLHYDNAPEVCASWRSFSAMAAPLPPVEKRVFDGVLYAHELWLDGRPTRASWLNPNWVEYPRQMLVIRSYVELCATAGLRRLVGMWRWPR